MLKYIFTIGFTLLLSQMVSGGTLFYNGDLSPKPQKVLSEWKFYNTELNDIIIKISAEDHKAITLAKKLLAERFEKISSQEHTVKSSKVVIYLGTAGTKLIDGECDRLGIDFDSHFMQPQGYIIRVKKDLDVTKIIACGTDHRGTFNAAMSILQMTGIENSHTGIKLADINDWPNWSDRYASEFHLIPDYDQLIEMLKFKINAYAIQHRYEWRNFTQETYKDNIPFFKQFKDDYDLMDYMLVLNLYSAWPRVLPMMDISKEEDVAQLIEVCEYAAQNGMKHIMICVDDWTPNDGERFVCIHQSERDRFDDSVAKAQGYLMTRLYTALKKNYPQIELSITPCVYSLYEHNLLDNAENFKYLRKLSENMPGDISVVWTGPQIVHDKVTRDDFLKYSRAVNGRNLTYWDNTEGVDLPITHWNTLFYDGFELDSSGTLFQNVRMYRLKWGRAFVANTNDYLWNTKGFDQWQSHKNAIEKLYGVGKFEPVRKFIEKQRIVKKQEDCQLRKPLLRELTALVDKMQEDQLLGIEQCRKFISLKTKECDIVLPEINVPLLSSSPVMDGVMNETLWEKASVLNFRHNSGKDEKIHEIQGRIFYTSDAIYLGFEVTFQGELPTPGYAKKRDDTVYSSNDAIEMFFQTDGEKEYSHLVFDHAENIFDEFSSSENYHLWNPDWQVKTSKQGNKWFAEVRVTHSAFGEEKEVQPVKGSVWKANFIRAYNVKRHSSAWSPTYNNGNFHDDVFWGNLIFE